MQERIHVYSSANQNKNINFFDKCLNSDMLVVSEDDSSLLLKLQQQPIYFFRKNPNAVEKCLKSVDTIVNQIAASQQCYDGSIISNFIYEVDASINLHKVSTNSEVRKIHIFAQKKITDIMEIIGREWDEENSVLAKLKRNKEDLYEYFMMVSQGAEKTKLFAVTMANALKRVLMSGN
jgi:hypothetical protein